MRLISGELNRNRTRTEISCIMEQANDARVQLWRRRRERLPGGKRRWPRRREGESPDPAFASLSPLSLLSRFFSNDSSLYLRLSLSTISLKEGARLWFVLGVTKQFGGRRPETRRGENGSDSCKTISVFFLIF